MVSLLNINMLICKSSREVIGPLIGGALVEVMDFQTSAMVSPEQHESGLCSALK